MGHSKGIIDLVVNDSTNYPVKFLGGAGTSTSSDKMVIQGFGEFAKTGVTRAYAVRGVAATKQLENITAATAGEITVTGTITTNSIAIVDFTVGSYNNEAYMGQARMTYGKSLRLPIRLSSGETAGTFLAKVYNMLRQHLAIGQYPISIHSSTAGTFSNGVATTLTELVLESTDADWYWTSKVTDVAGNPHSNITVWVPTKTVSSFSGRGTAAELYANTRLRTGASTMPWGIKTDQNVSENGTDLYTRVFFDFSKTDGKKNGFAVDETVTSSSPFEIWVKETGSGYSTYTTALLNFFDQQLNYGLTSDNTLTKANNARTTSIAGFLS